MVKNKDAFFSSPVHFISSMSDVYEEVDVHCFGIYNWPFWRATSRKVKHSALFGCKTGKKHASLYLVASTAGAGASAVNNRGRVNAYLLLPRNTT
jgi:hypothetical protein